MESKELQGVNRGPRHSSKTDYQQELKLLISRLESDGYRVRREHLKQGHGWKTISGSCRVHGDRLILVDRKLPIEDQLVFLRSLAADGSRIAPPTGVG